jgi:hypothetical protein
LSLESLCEAVRMSNLTRFTFDENGKTVYGDDGTKSYVLRRGRGLSTVAPVLRFSRRKPRYTRRGNLLVMGCARKPLR